VEGPGAAAAIACKKGFAAVLWQGALRRACAPAAARVRAARRGGCGRRALRAGRAGGRGRRRRWVFRRAAGPRRRSRLLAQRLRGRAAQHVAQPAPLEQLID
jgi:hypothetical protein